MINALARWRYSRVRVLSKSYHQTRFEQARLFFIFIIVFVCAFCIWFLAHTKLYPRFLVILAACPILLMCGYVQFAVAKTILDWSQGEGEETSV